MQWKAFLHIVTCCSYFSCLCLWPCSKWVAKHIMLCFAYGEVPASHSKMATLIFLFQVGKKNKIFIVLSPCFFQPLLIKLEKNSVKKGDHSRCCPAQADVLNHKSLLEWKGHKEDAPKFLLLLTYFPCAPVLFKWCQLVYTAYCYGKYFFFLRLCLLGFSLFLLFLSKFKCNCI